MNHRIIRKYSFRIASAFVAFASMATLSSCDAIMDDLQPCPQGVKLRFVYDYNMEFANAFPAQVDCLTVLVYDEQGNYVTTKTNATDDLKDENWRMAIDLKPGRYTIVSYGGMDCDKSSFHFVTDPAETKLTALEVAMNSDLLKYPVGPELHNLFYGKINTVEIEEEDMTYRDYTVEMMRDTNDFRVILQQIDGDPLDEADFEFSITDDNTLFAWDNAVIPTREVEYFPWARGNEVVGELPLGGMSQVCWAEMSTSRLIDTRSLDLDDAPSSGTVINPAAKPGARLHIVRRSDGYIIVDIPLVNYLLLMKSERYKDMPNQEFLDRENTWNMIFFLDRNHAWLKTQIIINDWVVRLNDIDNI